MGLDEVVARCVSAAATVDARDYIKLALLHADLASAEQLAHHRPAAAAAAAAAAKLVESIVMGTVADTAATLRDVRSLVGLLNSLVGGPPNSGNPGNQPGNGRPIFR